LFLRKSQKSKLSNCLKDPSNDQSSSQIKIVFLPKNQIFALHQKILIDSFLEADIVVLDNTLKNGIVPLLPEQHDEIDETDWRGSFADIDIAVFEEEGVLEDGFFGGVSQTNPAVAEIEADDLCDFFLLFLSLFG
jgi:hypothetical protein